jgi:hypothetical integral membrane protein (TIGR02206 family)
MSHYFSGYYPDNPFTFFSLSHLLTLGIIGLLGAGLFLTRNRFAHKPVNLPVRYGLVILLVLLESSLHIWKLCHGFWSVTTSLPLHLCGVAIILSVIMLIKKDYTLYEICYFWGLGGAIQALLTPDIAQYGFPHFRFFQFFGIHACIVLAALFMTFVEDFRPQHRTIWKVFIITNIYTGVIGLLNWLLDSNYLFICSKPVSGSLMDFLGPWPWYILSLEGVGLLSFYLYYLPFAIKDRLKGKPKDKTLIK